MPRGLGRRRSPRARRSAGTTRSPIDGASTADRALSARCSSVRSSALAVLASPAALTTASKRARHASERLAPAA
eukprot:15475874-Alexandrium_andersonii.AAC.1